MHVAHTQLDGVQPQGLITSQRPTAWPGRVLTRQDRYPLKGLATFNTTSQNPIGHPPDRSQTPVEHSV